MFGLVSGLARATASITTGAVYASVNMVVGVGQTLLAPAATGGRVLVEDVLELNARRSSRPRVIWSAGSRLHIDVGSLLADGPSPRLAACLEETAQAVPGVASAHVEPALARLVVQAEPDQDLAGLGRRVVGAVAEADIPGGTRTGPAPRPHGDSPSRPDPAPRSTAPARSVAVPVVGAAMNVAAVIGAVAGWVGRFPPAPRAARAAVAVVRYQPRVVALLEPRLGRVGTDLLLTAATALAHGWGQAPAVPMLDLAQRIGQLGETLAYRRAWAEWEPVLAGAGRPRPGPLPAVTEEPLVEGGSGDGGGKPVESYIDQAASGSLVAAAGALLAGGGSEDVAGAVLAGVPKAAQLGREAFAVLLGRGLAQRRLLVLDPGALRRLDQVAVVLIDGAALRGDHRMVLHAEGHAPGWDDDRVYEVGDALLHGETAPDPDPDEAPATGARLRWATAGTPATGAPARGHQHAQLVVEGQAVGELELGWEPDQYALALVETARRTGARVVLRHVAGTAELATSVTETYPAETPLAELVHTLTAERGPVLLVSSLRPDLDTADTLAALAAARVSVALDDPKAAAAWTADIITSPELAEAVRVLSALPSARAVSAAGVRLAKAGSTLEGLLLTAGEPSGGSRWWTINRWLSPTSTTAAIALLTGALTARAVLSLPDPTPVPLTAWHALDPEIVFTRLSGGPVPLAEGPAIGLWRRRLAELGEDPVLAPVRWIVAMTVRLAEATRAELNDPLTPVLAVGAAASAMLGSGVDAALVATVMAVNALIGGAQRLRAEEAAAALFAEQDQLARRVPVPALGSRPRRLAAARNSRRAHIVSARRLRPGDVIALRAPDVVPADARLLTAVDLEVDESSLTGESMPVAKHTEQTPDAPLSERTCMVFEGSTVVAGSARAVVVATGAATAARRAIDTVGAVGPPVGVAARLGELTRNVLPLTLAGGVAVTGLSLLNRQPLRQAVADGVAIAVTAVPEGLPLVATVAQLAAARRLSTRGVLVRSPRAIEALGRVDTICFDKTGTLTENTLRLTTTATLDWDPTSPPPELGAAEADEVLRLAARACPHPDNAHAHAHATDEAILRAAAEPSEAWRVLEEVPFESSRGYAATVGVEAGADAEPSVLVVKGAPEVVLERCAADPDTLARAHAVAEGLAGHGLRVLAVARRPLRPGELPEPVGGPAPDQDPEDAGADIDAFDELVDRLEPVGFVGIADTVRRCAPALIDQLVAAGRDTVLITGDHPVTAAAIARQLGLPAGATVVTGAQLAERDEAGRADLARDGRIFARVSPEQKVQVIEALTKAGRTCAMVGDGANDAAAIRMATVGIGVSNRGSQAARGAADLVLTDDDLTALLDALAEGRNMWACVRDALVILLGGNAGEVAFTIAGTTIGGRAPISTRQLLLVNLLTDMFPALAVAVTPQQAPPEAAWDREAYRAHRQAILTAPAPSLDRPLLRAIVSRGGATAAAATGAWAIGQLTPGTRCRSATMGLTALVGAQLAQTLTARRHSPLVLATAAGSAAALVGIVQTPGVSHFFGCTPLGPVAWAGVLATTAAATTGTVLLGAPVRPTHTG
jgi:cation-transporting ATPase I